MTRPHAPEPIVIYGAGELGREVLDVVEAINRHSPAYDFLGFLDDDEVDSELLHRRGTQFLHGVAEAPNSSYVIGIGNPEVRHSIDDRLSAEGLEATVTSPKATPSSVPPPSRFRRPDATMIPRP